MTDIRKQPQVSASGARKVLAQAYGIEAEVKSLPSERDQNFQVNDEKDRRFVFKISNPQELKDTIVFQNEALDRIRETDPSLNVPRIIRSNSGDKIIRIVDDEGKSFHARLYTYLDGELLANVDTHSPELLIELGRFLARLDNAMAGYWHPASRRELKWSLFSASEVVRANLQYISDSERRAIIEYFLSAFEGFVSPKLWQLPLGVIHNDANDYNVVIVSKEGALPQIAGLLDFGDLIFGPYIYEPAVAAAYAMMGEKEPLEAASAVLAGYHAEHSLNPTEINLFYYLIGIRLVSSVTLAAAQRKAVPDNPYLSVSEESAWELLEYLISIEPSKATRIFLKACDFPADESGLEPDQIQEREKTSRSESQHFV